MLYLLYIYIYTNTLKKTWRILAASWGLGLVTWGHGWRALPGPLQMASRGRITARWLFVPWIYMIYGYSWKIPWLSTNKNHRNHRYYPTWLFNIAKPLPIYRWWMIYLKLWFSIATLKNSGKKSDSYGENTMNIVWGMSLPMWTIPHSLIFDQTSHIWCLRDQLIYHWDSSPRGWYSQESFLGLRMGWSSLQTTSNRRLKQLRYCMPSNADTVLCIDPDKQQMMTIGGPLEGDWKWHGGNLGDVLWLQRSNSIIAVEEFMPLGIEHPALWLRMATSMASLQMPRRPMMGCNGHSLGECWSTDNQVPRLGVAMLREYQAFLSVKPFRLPAAATCEQCPPKNELLVLRLGGAVRECLCHDTTILQLEH